MPRKYREEKRKKTFVQDSIENKKSRIVIEDEVTCIICMKPSGWANDVLRYITGDRELKCKNCGETCVKIFVKKN